MGACAAYEKIKQILFPEADLRSVQFKLVSIVVHCSPVFRCLSKRVYILGFYIEGEYIIVLRKLVCAGYYRTSAV